MCFVIMTEAKTPTLWLQVESVEQGISELEGWLDEGEALLGSHKVDGNINTLEERLEKHQQHFQHTPHYSSLLDSKNKLHQKIVKSPGQYLDRSDLDLTMQQLNNRFKVCTLPDVMFVCVYSYLHR